jgi:hypothetical protein
MLRFQRFLALAQGYEHPSRELARLAADAEQHLTQESARLAALSPQTLLRNSERYCGPTAITGLLRAPAAHAPSWRADDGFVQDPAAVRPYRRGMLFHSSTGVPVADAHDDFLWARRGVALTAGGVTALATGAVALVTIPALWILRGGPGCPIVARGRLELEGTR